MNLIMSDIGEKCQNLTVKNFGPTLGEDTTSYTALINLDLQTMDYSFHPS